MDETQGNYSSMVGGPTPSLQAAAFGPMLQQQAPGFDPSSIAKPAGTPEEVEQRKAGWQQVMSNPAFVRAMAMMGAHLAQPTQAGQTTLGHVAAAGATGMAAFDMGEYSKYEQDRQAKADALKATESEANVASTKAGTAIRTAQLPGVVAESDVATRTAGAKIEGADVALKQAKLKLDSATKEEEVASIERDLRARKAKIEKDIPDEKVREAAMAEVDATILKLSEARARIKASESSATASDAAAAKSRVGTAHDQITVDVLNGMDKQEQKEFLTKSGRYNTHVSSASVTRDMYGNIYDSLKRDTPNDTRIKGKTREQFVLDGTTSQKSLDATTGLKNYTTAIQAANMDPDPEVIQAFTDQIKAGVKARSGTPDAAVTGPITWKRDAKGNLVKVPPGAAGASGAAPASPTPEVKPTAPATPPAEDTNKYTRKKDNRGSWDYTLQPRGGGKTKAEWAAEDAKGN